MLPLSSVYSETYTSNEYKGFYSKLSLEFFMVSSYRLRVLGLYIQILYGLANCTNTRPLTIHYPFQNTHYLAFYCRIELWGCNGLCAELIHYTHHCSYCCHSSILCCYIVPHFYHRSYLLFPFLCLEINHYCAHSIWHCMTGLS